MPNQTGSRAERYEKQRKDTKKINRLILLAVLLVLLLIGFIIFGGSDDEEDINEDQNNEENELNDEDEQPVDEGESEEDGTTNGENDEATENNGDDDNTNGNEDDLATGGNAEEEHLDSDDPNVLNVIVKEWSVLETEQEEPHVINLNEDSIDRQEIELAIASALELNREQLTYWWLESGGIPDRIVGTVEDRQSSEIFRVYLNWIENEGWKPNRVEVLLENDSPPYLQQNSNDEEDELEENDEAE